MKLYAAPMEGLTGFAWRKAHAQVFGGADKYFTPFLVANQTHKFKSKELRDISQSESDLVPQIITDKPEHFIWAARELQSRGFDEINLNLGCPSATVVTRGKGSGLLREPDRLDAMLEEIYSKLPDLKISLKTRIGFSDKSEWPALFDIYRKYPVYELIIHPRLRQEFYEGSADYDLFLETLGRASLPLVYNGDITSAGAPAVLMAQSYEATDLAGYESCSLNVAGGPMTGESSTGGFDIMAGRGLLADPALFRQIRGGAAATASELLDYHDLIVEYYSQYMSGDGPVIHHMKSMWVYFQELFEYDDRTMKNLRKSKRLSDYMTAAHSILANPK